MGYDQYTVSDDCTCRTYFCCFRLALANTFPRPFVPILSNFFKDQWTKNHPQCLSGQPFDNLSRNSFIHIFTYCTVPLQTREKILSLHTSDENLYPYFHIRWSCMVLAIAVSNSEKIKTNNGAAGYIRSILAVRNILFVKSSGHRTGTTHSYTSNIVSERLT